MLTHCRSHVESTRVTFPDGPGREASTPVNLDHCPARASLGFCGLSGLADFSWAPGCLHQRPEPHHRRERDRRADPAAVRGGRLVLR